MRGKAGLIVAPVVFIPGAALAGAWPQAPSATQVITSYEPGSADRAYDVTGHASLHLTTWQQTDVTVFIDHGINQHFTFTAKADFQNYRTATTRFSGLGYVEAGGRWTVHRGKTFVFAVGASVQGLGQGRRSDVDVTAKPGTDYDVRAYAGKSFHIGSAEAFVDLQGARHLRQNAADEWRVDATFGVKPSPRLMVLAQVFAGQGDKQAWGQSKWANSQVSVVRSFGLQQNLSLQVGFRRTAAGQNVPAMNTVVVALWKKF